MERCGEGYIRAFRRFLFPEYCYACGKELLDEEKLLCKECIDEFPLTYFWSWHDNPGRARLLENGAIDNYYALFFYTHESNYRNLIHSFKYQGDTRVGFELAKWLGKYIASDKNYTGFDAIIPIPLHFYKHWKRGYNQSEIIAKGIAEELGNIPVLKRVIVRTRNTTTQTHLSNSERYENVRGVFKVIKPISDNIIRQSPSKKGLYPNNCSEKRLKHILLVDDVLTTGATIESAYTAIIEVCRGCKVSFATLGYVE